MRRDKALSTGGAIAAFAVLCAFAAACGLATPTVPSWSRGTSNAPARHGASKESRPSGEDDALSSEHEHEHAVGRGAPTPTPTLTPTSLSSTASLRSPSVPAAPRSPFAYANVDLDDDLLVAPPEERASCADDLAAAGVVFKKASLRVHTERASRKTTLTCGAPQIVLYQKSPAKIVYEPAVMLTCTMALALARFETILQEEAKRVLGKRVVKIHHLGTYSCREILAYPGWVSEHSYANAIDLADFVLEDGRTIGVLQRFAPKLELAATRESVFLRAAARRAFDEDVFSHVLTPFFDPVHANHFHLDLARYRGDGTRFMAPTASAP